MTDGFGARLRHERERRHISLEAIASATKINIALFKALERDDASRWPPGIFGRSFIRAYANAVGLDPESVLRDFAECFPDPTEVGTAHAAPARPAPVRRHDPIELRLYLASDAARPTGRRLVDHTLNRCAAVACDAVLLSALAFGAFAVFDRFWMPAAVAMIAYYSGSVMLLGHTPGVLFVGTVLRRRERADRTPAVCDAESVAGEGSDTRHRDAFINSTTITAG